jgi:UDP-N-acetylbacillosamine N-acetyltransferase
MSKRVAPTIAVWGAGGHALVVADIIRLGGEYEIVGFLDDERPDRKGLPFCGSRILGGREQLVSLKRYGVQFIALAFGDDFARLRLAARLDSWGFKQPSLVHPGAIVAQGLSLGAGAIIAAGAIVNPQTCIGRQVIVNTAASVDHGCLINDGAHIGPGVRLGGGVHIGRRAHIGIGAIVSDHLCIGDDTIIGAGAVVLRDIPGQVVAYGVPARVIRAAEAGR